MSDMVMKGCSVCSAKETEESDQQETGSGSVIVKERHEWRVQARVSGLVSGHERHPLPFSLASFFAFPMP
jgi:hypothetical protein